MNRYCNNKREYDRFMLSQMYSNHIPSYEEACDGSYEAYYQRIMQLEQIRATKQMADAIRIPSSINVNHSGTIKYTNY